jgi:hypothetical protein
METAAVDISFFLIQKQLNYEYNPDLCLNCPCINCKHCITELQTEKLRNTNI